MCVTWFKFEVWNIIREVFRAEFQSALLVLHYIRYFLFTLLNFHMKFSCLMKRAYGNCDFITLESFHIQVCNIIYLIFVLSLLWLCDEFMNVNSIFKTFCLYLCLLVSRAQASKVNTRFFFLQEYVVTKIILIYSKNNKIKLPIHLSLKNTIQIMSILLLAKKN